MAIDTEAMVTPLAYEMCCNMDGRCFCRENFADPCPYLASTAKTALRLLLPKIIELCAEEAEKESCDNSKAGRLDEAFGAMGACNRIRALIPTQGADHG